MCRRRRTLRRHLEFDIEDETFTIYPKPQPEADSPKIQVTQDGAIWYSPRGSVDAPGMADPDMDKFGRITWRVLYPFASADTSPLMLIRLFQFWH